MEYKKPILALKALAHAHRLTIYRILVRTGHQGLTVGSLQEKTGHAPASLSNHLNVLRKAGLVNDRRVGRNIWCRADYGKMNALIGFLTENCCAGERCEVLDRACVPVSIARKSTKKKQP